MYVIAGAGPAGDAAAAGLREGGYDGPLLLIGAEALPPYDRTHLSKAYLTGKLPLEALPLRSPDHYRELDIQLELGHRVESLNPGEHTLELDDGRRLRYERVLLATGAEPRRPAGVDATFELRHVGDADRLRHFAALGAPLTILGAGFIGCEVAAALHELGVEVTLFERLDAPLVRVLGPELGRFIAEAHRQRGVHLHLGAEASQPPSGPVLAAVGSRPRTELAESAGIAVDAGIVVDAGGRTSAPDVFAAGDASRFWSPVYGTHVRVEHFQTAQRQGFAAGLSMAGQAAAFAEVPWFWSDQYDLNIQYAGAGLAWDAVVVRGVLGEPPFTVFHLASGRLIAACSINDSRTLSRARRLIEVGITPSPEELAEPGFDLRARVPH